MANAGCASIDTDSDVDKNGSYRHCRHNIVCICHNENNPHTICISRNVVQHHLRNHEYDYLGECVDPSEEIELPDNVFNPPT